MVTAGDVLGSYRMLSVLGVGGMGEVWLAEHVILRRRVAIKVLRPEVSERADIAQRFFDEGRAAAQIAAPGIVQVFDYGCQGELAFLVMELLVGESLARRLSRGHFSPTQAAYLAYQIATTMAVAHACGIVHRDLKPDNIFLTDDAAALGGVRVKVLDFGIAKVLAESSTSTATGTVLGTPTYMSPEQCRDAAGVDHRTDVYALGCIIFEMLCGQAPFTGSAVEVIAAHLLEQPPSPTALGELAPVIARCLAKPPDERWASMTDVVRALGPVIGVAGDCPRGGSDPGRPLAYLTTLGTGTGQANRRDAPRSRMRSALAAVAILSGGALTAFATTRSTSETADGRGIVESPPVLVDAGNPAFEIAPGIERTAGRASTLLVIPAGESPPLVERSIDTPRIDTPRIHTPRRRPAATKALPATPAPTTPDTTAPTAPATTDDLYEDRGK